MINIFGPFSKKQELKKEQFLGPPKIDQSIPNTFIRNKYKRNIPNKSIRNVKKSLNYIILKNSVLRNLRFYEDLLFSYIFILLILFKIK
jgi:hypothetical protein